MKAIVGVFKSRSDAERGAAELVPSEIPKDRINSTGDAKVRLANATPRAGVRGVVPARSANRFVLQ
jgi:hypothetical protein